MAIAARAWSNGGIYSRTLRRFVFCRLLFPDTVLFGLTLIGLVLLGSNFFSSWFWGG